MSTTFRCDIVSAENEIFHGDAELLVATGEMGELGIAPISGTVYVDLNRDGTLDATPTDGRIAGFKRPRRVVVVDELPLNASGKVDKGLVRALVADRGAG